ncbi:MAG: hypothetical protein E8D47_01820 [Nitrospira sp.]|nr:MAG: hypothetical protein E8D47_01820 [Nitrospira sp.]
MVSKYLKRPSLKPSSCPIATSAIVSCRTLYGARPMRRTIQRAIGDPLSEEMIRGRFKDCRKIRVVLRDGAPAFIEQEAMAGV